MMMSFSFLVSVSFSVLVVVVPLLVSVSLCVLVVLLLVSVSLCVLVVLLLVSVSLGFLLVRSWSRRGLLGLLDFVRFFLIMFLRMRFDFFGFSS